MTEKDFGFTVDHIGINSANEQEALKIAGVLESLFGFEAKNGNSSVFCAGKRIEVMKKNYKGHNGHIAIGTSDIDGAVEYMKGKGILFDEQSAVVKEGKLIAVYLQDEIAGFAFHLVRK